MADNTRGRSFQQRVFEEIKQTTGACNVVVMPVAVLRLCGDRNIGLMLSHLIYWCDRGCNADGFIWKSYREWVKETGLTRYQIDKASAWLKKKGLLEVKKGMVGGHPTRHYKLNRSEFLDAIGFICRNQQMDLSKAASGICDFQQIHNIDYLTKTTTETLKGEKGGEAKNSSPLSLNAFLKEVGARGEQVEKEAVNVVDHFLKQYVRHRGEKHPALRYEQWKDIMASILSSSGTNDQDLTFEAHRAMIEKYFYDAFNDGDCDYRLSHYNSGSIKMNKMYEVAC